MEPCALPPRMAVGSWNSRPMIDWRTVAPLLDAPGAPATTGYSLVPLCLELRKALNSAMPVRRMGDFWPASTLVCACSSTRFSTTSRRSAGVSFGGDSDELVAGAPSCSVSLRTCSESSRFSFSRRSRRSIIRARSAAVWALSNRGLSKQNKRTSLLRGAIEDLLQFPAHLRRGKWFGEKRVDSQVGDPARGGGIRVRADHDDRHRRELTVFAYAPNQFVAIYIRHVQVGDDCLNGWTVIQDTQSLDRRRRHQQGYAGNSGERDF